MHFLTLVYGNWAVEKTRLITWSNEWAGPAWGRVKGLEGGGGSDTTSLRVARAGGRERATHVCVYTCTVVYCKSRAPPSFICPPPPPLTIGRILLVSWLHPPSFIRPHCNFQTFKHLPSRYLASDAPTMPHKMINWHLSENVADCSLGLHDIHSMIDHRSCCCLVGIAAIFR